MTVLIGGPQVVSCVECVCEEFEMRTFVFGSQWSSLRCGVI